MRISDWSSDVCSSDLKTPGERSSISRESRDFPRVQASADAKHDVSGVIPPFAATPRLQLLRQISGGLATKRRIGRTYPLPCKAMTCRTGDKTALGISIDIEKRKSVVEGKRVTE